MFKDRAIETIQAGFTGTGTYNLGGAAINSQALDAAFASGATMFYCVRKADWSKAEFGYGVITSGSPDTLTRTVLRAYNGSTWGTSAVNWQAGDHPIYVYSVPLGEILSSFIKTNAAATRPGWLPQYGMWLDNDTPSGTVWSLKLFDGADDITVGTFDTTANTFTPGGGPYVPTAGGVTIASSITMDTGAQILLPAGSAAAPALARSNNADTGIHFPADEVHFSINGTDQLTVSAGGLTIPSSIAVTGNIVGGAVYVPNGAKNVINSSGNLQVAALNGGSGASTSTFLRGDMTWAQAGAFKVLGHVSASNVANLSVAITGVWNYLLIFARILPSNNGANCLIRAFTSSLTILCDWSAASVSNNALLGGLRFTGSIHQPASTIRTAIIGQGAWYDNTSVFQTGYTMTPVATNGVVDNVGALAASGNVSGDLMVLGA